MQGVVGAFDDIVARAKALTPLEEESFDQWLVRLSNELALPDEAYEAVLSVSRSVAGAEGLELSDITTTQVGEEEKEREEESAPSEVADYLASLIESMGSLSDVMPARLPGRVTFTTMHGAKDSQRTSSTCSKQRMK